jgi:endonuclease G
MILKALFIKDNMVSSGSADWRNYRNSGFDNHLCPAVTWNLM